MRSTFTSALLLFALSAVADAQKIYTPEGGVRPSKGKVDIQLIRLLTAQDVVDRNISAEEVAAFIQRAEKIVADTVPADAQPFSLNVLVTLAPTSKPKFVLSYDHSPSQKLLQKIYDALKSLPDKRTKKDSIRFEIDFVIKAKP